MILSAFSATLSAQTFVGSGGNGTSKKPYLISSRADLDELSNAIANNPDTGNVFENIYFQVTNDIDMGANAFTPIGGGLGGTSFTDSQPAVDMNELVANARAFSGIFDGNGKTIANMSCRDGRESALFGYVRNASIQKVILKNATATGVYAGALAAVAIESEISDCTLTSGTIYAFAEGDRTCSGGLFGRADSAKILGCHVDSVYIEAAKNPLADTALRYYIGGLIGVQVYSAIALCTANAEIDYFTTTGGFAHLGGFTAVSHHGEIINSTAALRCAFDVTGTNKHPQISTATSVGGFIASSGAVGSVTNPDRGTLINNCKASLYLRGETDSIARAGGFIYTLSRGLINQCFAVADIDFTCGNASYTGGFTGLMASIDGGVFNSYATGKIKVNSSQSATHYIAGFCGAFSKSAETNIEGCYTDCETETAGTGAFHVGGFLGYAGVKIDTGVITDCYAHGKITANNTGNLRAGGFAGYTTRNIYNSYSTTSIENNATGTTYVGGFIGQQATASIENTYFDTETSGTTTAVGNGSSDGITGLTTAQMANTAAVYSDSFTAALNDGANIWKSSLYFYNGGYPILAWQRMIIPTPLAVFPGNYATPDSFRNNGVVFPKKGSKFTASYIDLWPKAGKPAKTKKVGMKPYSIGGINVDSLLVKGKVLLSNKKAYNTARKTTFTANILDSDIGINKIAQDWTEVPVAATVNKVASVPPQYKLYGVRPIVEKTRVMVDYRKKKPAYYMIATVRYAGSKPKAIIEFTNLKNGKLAKGGCPMVKEKTWAKKLPVEIVNYANNAKLAADGADVVILKLNKNYTLNTRVDLNIDNGNAMDAITLKK